jgi:hypothetical protein
MNHKNNQEPDAFAHGPVYLAARRFVRRNTPFLIVPWTAFKRIVWTLQFPTAEARFKQIHKTNYWANSESLSGEGSTLEATRKVREAIVDFIQKHAVGSMLDIPCGDFNWMKQVELNIPYTGGDIVDDLILLNQKEHVTDQRSFQVIDLTKGPLPRRELVFSRDCLNHLSFQDIEKAIKNICSSGAHYLAVTQFPAQTINRDQGSGFTYRELNYHLAPFNWPEPLVQYDEQYHPGKHLCFWKISDLPNHKAS